MAPHAKTYAYGKKYKGCPCCITTENAQRYFAHCTSEKNPKYHGRPVEIKDTDKGAICIGRKIGGMSYTSCPYYIRGGSKAHKESKAKETQRAKERQEASVEMAQIIKVLKFTVAALIILYILSMVL